MSGQEETLRLAAEVVNKWSGPLAEFRRDLQNLGKSAKGVHAEGEKHAKEHAKAFGELKHAVHEVGERVRSGLEPAFEAFGVTAISVAGAVAAVAEAIKGFAGSSRELNFFSREVGFSINQLRELDALSKRIGSSPEAMRAGISTFAKNMEELRRHRGALNQFFASQHDVNVRRFGNDLSHAASNAEAFGRSLEFLDRIHDPVQRQNFLAALGLDPKLARLSASELRAALKDIRTNIGTLSDEGVKKGAAAQAAFDKLAETVEKLKEEVGSELAPTITKLTEAIATFVDKNRDGLVKTLSDLARWIEHTDWAGFTKNLRDTAAEVNHVADAFGGWANVAKILIGLKIASEIAKVTLALRALFALAAPPWLTAVMALLSLKGDTNKQAEDYGIARKLGLTDKEAGRSDVRGPGGIDYSSLPSVVRSFGKFLYDHPAKPAAGAADVERKVQEGTEKGAKKGVIEGLKEWLSADPISYTPDGSGGGAPRAYGGGRFKLFAPRGPGASFGGGGASMGAGGHAGAGSGGGGGSGAGGGGGGVGGWWTPERQKYAIDYLMKNAGLSEMGAKGLVARWAGVEAGRGPGEFNTVGGGHFGIGQWSRSRFRGATLGDFEGQLALAARELNSSESRAAGALRRARTAQEAAVGASMFERAEGYNPATGRDAFVEKTIRAMGALGDRGKVSPELMARWRAMMAAAPKGVRESSRITSGFRTFAQQAAAYWRFQHHEGGIAARPGHSRHEFGLALDVHDPTGWIHRNAGRFGLTFPLGRRDPPHMQMDPDYDGPSFFRGSLGHYYRQHILDRARAAAAAPDSPAHPHFYRQHILDHARRAGVIGGAHTIKGDASLRIDLNGFPRGTRTRSEASGMFRQVALNRGKAMTMASAEA